LGFFRLAKLKNDDGDVDGDGDDGDEIRSERAEATNGKLGEKPWQQVRK